LLPSVHAFYLLRLQQTETHYIPINHFWSNLIENMPGCEWSRDDVKISK